MEFFAVIGFIMAIIVLIGLISVWAVMIEETHLERKTALRNEDDRERVVKATRKLFMWIFMPVIFPFVLLFLIVKVLVYWVSLLVNVSKDLFMGKKSASVEDKEEVEL